MLEQLNLTPKKSEAVKAIIEDGKLTSQTIPKAKAE
jgi:hypothetical protein